LRRKPKLTSSGVIFTGPEIKIAKELAKRFQSSRSAVVGAALQEFNELDDEVQADTITQARLDRGASE